MILPWLNFVLKSVIEAPSHKNKTIDQKQNHKNNVSVHYDAEDNDVSKH